MRLFALIATIMALTLSPLSAKEYQVLVYHGANPPYYYLQQGKETGLFVDIFAELAQRTGHQFTFMPLSVARGSRFFDQGKVDIEPGINPLWRQDAEVPGIYSISYAFSREVILGRANSCPVNAAPEDFYGALVGKVRGYSYGDFDAHLSSSGIVVYENISEKELLAQLAYQRLDYIMIGDVTADFYIANQEAYRGFKECYEISRLPVHMRLQPKLTQLQQTMNKALRQMVNDGTVKAIYSKYRLSH
ncbi:MULTISPECIES: substrate-binding periplasmic protein [unclassified Pseudoalteromonas]|uniref:substrate-binding periplasmic protein n=1 Tax=unclassified Pseudoalteromonas TaxID=194690 RepID=UPI0030152F6E